MTERDSHLSTLRALELIALLESLELEGPQLPTLAVVNEPGVDETTVETTVEIGSATEFGE